MTDKEFIQNEIDYLEDIRENVKKEDCKIIIKQCEEDIKQYNQVLKDLERLEEQDKILEILKKNLKEDGYYGILFINKRDLSKDDYNLLKEWLNND